MRGLEGVVRVHGENRGPGRRGIAGNSCRELPGQARPQPTRLYPPDPLPPT